MADPTTYFDDISPDYLFTVAFVDHQVVYFFLAELWSHLESIQVFLQQNMNSFDIF